MTVYSFSSKKNLFLVWDRSTSYEPLDHYRRYNISTYKYIGTRTEVTEDLDPQIGDRVRSFKVKFIEFITDNHFRFGRYAGKDITEVKDLRYTAWYFKEIESLKDGHRQFIRDFLYNNWYEFKTDEEGREYPISPTTVKKHNDWEKKQKEMMNKAENGMVVTLDIERNPNEDGRIFVNGIAYYFPKVVTRYYRDSIYHLPLLNGKVKRVKNRSIRASLMVIGDKIYIANFKILK